MDHRRATRSSDRGETLVELLVAVSILGIAAVAIIAGLWTSVKASDIHRKEASGGAYVRSFAEAIQNKVDSNGGYESCADAASDYADVAVLDLPPGFTKAVTQVQSWNGSAWGPCTGDGIQRLDLTVTSTGDVTHRAVEKLTVVLRKPCNDSAANMGDSPCG